METELNKQKQVFQIKNTSLLLEFYCYINIGVIINIIIVITINDDGIIGVSSGDGSSSVMQGL